MFNAGVIARGAGGTFPTFVSAVTDGSSTNASVSLSEPAGAQDNDLLVACIWIYDDTGPSITTPLGWTQLASSTSGPNLFKIYAKRRSGATGTYIFQDDNLAGVEMAGHGTMFCFRGSNPALALSSAIENPAAVSGSAAQPVTVSGSNRLAVHIGFYVGSISDPPSGWTEIVDTASSIRRTAAEVRNAATAGTYTPTTRVGPSLANVYTFAIRST